MIDSRKDCMDYQWCPFSRARASASIEESATSGYNRDGEYSGVESIPTKGCHCLGHHCMAWRTVDGDPEVGFCGMAPVLPYPLRDGGVGQSHGSGPEIIGDHGYETTAVRS